MRTARRLRRFFRGRWTVGGLVRFHTAHKLILMAHSIEGYRELGRLTAAARALPRADVGRRYTSVFMRSLACVATRRRHTNVLQHMAGYLKNRLDAASRSELQGAIENYRLGLAPRAVPLTLLRHHVRVHDVGYLAGQFYLDAADGVDDPRSR